MTRSPRRGPRAALALGLAGVLGSALPAAYAGAAEPVATTTSAGSAASARATRLPLSGLTIALDPGHQLGARHFPRQLHVQVPAGGFTKDCQTTGTSTNAGYPEATVNWQLASRVKARLEALGARVAETRTSNSESAWGPCVDVRGRFPGRVGATLMVSLHADGAPAAAHGFHVIVPVKGWGPTQRTAAPSLRLAKALRAGLQARGFARSSYIGGGTALSIRSDLATLNLSTVPVAMIEVGNMRNAGDARVMTHAPGQARYADAVVAGIRAYLGR